MIKTFPRSERLDADDYNAFLVLFQYTQDNQIQVSQTLTLTFSSDLHPVANTSIESLDPSTRYNYTYFFSQSESLTSEDIASLFAEGKMSVFSFSTLGIALKPFNFIFGAASCADTGSESSVFTNLIDENLSFFLHMGDMHYQNIRENDQEQFYQAYYSVFNSSTQKRFFQDTPIFYVWDDHDFGPDNSRGTSPSRDAVHAVYKAIVPYAPLKAVLPEDDSEVFTDAQAPSAVRVGDEYNLTYKNDDPYGIFQSFMIGRCFFIVMDLRSFKDVKPDDILADEQKVCLENQFKFVSLNNDIKMVFLVSTMFWLDNNNEGEWSAYPDTQALIGEYVRKYVYSNGKELIGLSGDTHAMAFDNGTNNYKGGFPVIQAAPLDSFPICAGGPYTHGVYVDRGQYSIIEVQDDGGDKVCVKFALKKLGVEFIKYDTCHKELYPGTAGVPCPKLVVGGTEGFGFITYIIIGVIVIGIIGGFIAWFCLRRYRDKDKKVEDEAVELLDVSHRLEGK